MVPDMSESRLLMMYIEGLIEPLCGWVNDLKPITLPHAIEHNKYFVGVAYKNKVTPRSPIIPKRRETRQFDKGKGKMDEATRRELARKQLCFTCKEPWHPGHRCMGKGEIHYIEVIFDSEDDMDEEESGPIHNIDMN